MVIIVRAVGWCGKYKHPCMTPMKTIAQLTAFLLLIALTGCLTACANLETNAYKVLASTATVVDNSMNAWGDWVRAGYATPDDEVRVQQAYEKYQATMAVAK